MDGSFAYVEQRQWDKAAADYGKAIELSPNDADFRAGRGRAYAELGQWDKAAEDFGRAVLWGESVNPPPEEAVRTLRVLDALGRSAREGQVVAVAQ